MFKFAQRQSKWRILNIVVLSFSFSKFFFFLFSLLYVKHDTEHPLTFMKISEHYWENLGTAECLWKSMVISENAWTQLNTYENLLTLLKLSENCSKHLWKSLVISENAWTQLNTYENLLTLVKLSENCSGHLWKSLVVCENVWILRKTSKNHCVNSETVWKPLLALFIADWSSTYAKSTLYELYLRKTPKETENKLTIRTK